MEPHSSKTSAARGCLEGIARLVLGLVSALLIAGLSILAMLAAAGIFLPAKQGSAAGAMFTPEITPLFFLLIFTLLVFVPPWAMLPGDSAFWSHGKSLIIGLLIGVVASLTSGWLFDASVWRWPLLALTLAMIGAPVLVFSIGTFLKRIMWSNPSQSLM